MRIHHPFLNDRIFISLMQRIKYCFLNRSSVCFGLFTDRVQQVSRLLQLMHHRCAGKINSMQRSQIDSILINSHNCNHVPYNTIELNEEKIKCSTFVLQDLISNSSYCLPNDSHYVSLENLVSDQLVIR